jgi:penicillin-binding protein 1B
MAGLPRKPAPDERKRRGGKGRRRWLRYLLAAFALLLLITGGVAYYFYVSFAELIDARLHGERERTLPRVYARPIELRRGQALSEADLIVRLNDLGYAHRAQVQRPGEFAVLRDTVAMRPRSGAAQGKTITVTFTAPAAGRKAAPSPPAIRAIEIKGEGAQNAVELDTPLLTALMTSNARQKRRHMPLASMPKHVKDAVLAIEDQSFYSHPGINPFPLITTLVVNGLGLGERRIGSSTITQQLARMFFLSDEFNAELQRGERSYWRKAREGVMSLVLERRASKDEILELYLNDVYLGQRGSFAIHGVAEASRIFFGKDVANVTIAEAALIAGVIQSPASRSPFTNPKRSVERRNLVIRAMADEALITEEQATRATREPLQVVARAVDSEAPYFVDMVAQHVNEQFPGLTARPGATDVHTTLDMNLQRAALDAVRRGLNRVDQLLAKRKRTNVAQAALIAVDPKTGEILAMVGGRSYNQSQYNRATVARRQPGSVFKPFVFLAAFEAAAEEGRTDFTPASITLDEPMVFDVNGEPWEPRNYDDYDGEITWRRALAMSRNLGTIHVGEAVGFDKVAALWKRVGVGTPPRAYPSISLGVFELTPIEVAQAYTLFLNDGAVRPLVAIDRIESGGKALRPQPVKPKQVARPDTTFLVVNMMRSVINEGTGAGVRAQGFTHDAAGKTGTTNDLRDAWFVGFTPDLLTVVWVGYDNNQPLSLSGSQAAVPIWTDFMKAAMAGHPNQTFAAPAGISYVEIDRDTGKLATPLCERTMNEVFVAGTEPTEYCPLHSPEAAKVPDHGEQ